MKYQEIAEYINGARMQDNSTLVIMTALICELYAWT